MEGFLAHLRGSQTRAQTLSRVFAINAGSHAHSYIYQVFLGAYLISTVKVPLTMVLQMLLLGGLAAIPAAFMAGRASDKWGRKPVNLFILAFLLLFSFPAFWLINTGNVWLIATVYALGFALLSRAPSQPSQPCSLNCSAPDTGTPVSPWPASSPPSSAAASLP